MRTSSAAKEPEDAGTDADGLLELGHLCPPQALRGPEEVDEPVTGEQQTMIQRRTFVMSQPLHPTLLRQMGFT